MKIAIASGKGGTGKTTIAVNLAAYIAASNSCLLMDLDVEEPNCAMFLGNNFTNQQQVHREIPSWTQETCSLCCRCRDVCQFGAILKLGDNIMVLPGLCHSCHACSELCPSSSLPMGNAPLGTISIAEMSSLQFVEAKLDIGVEQATPLIHRALQLVDQEYSEYHYQLYDCPPGTSCSVMAATRNADIVILVTEPTPFGLYDLSLAVETMRHLGKKMAVVVNRVGIGNDDVMNYCAQEKLDVIACIPNNLEIARSYSRGELLYEKFPEMATELGAILQYLDAKVCVR